jgi:hypothetical protein
LEIWVVSCKALCQADIAAEVQGRYGSPVDNTAHAILASLLANATIPDGEKAVEAL